MFLPERTSTWSRRSRSLKCWIILEEDFIDAHKLHVVKGKRFWFKKSFKKVLKMNPSLHREASILNPLK